MEQSASISASNSVKETIAAKLEQAAGSLEKCEEGGLGPYSRQASQWLRHSAEYVRRLDIAQTDKDIRTMINAHPGRSILVSMAAGVLIGAWIRHR